MKLTEESNDSKIEMKREKIVVWFSCGVASAVAAKRTIETYSELHDVVVVNTPVKEEDEDNRRFLKDVEKWIGQSIEICTSKHYPNSSAVEVWSDRKYMSGIHGAPCTLELKKEARYQWEVENKPDFHVLGFTLDEKSRYERFIVTERSNVIAPLIIEHLTKQDCFDMILEAGITPPRVYAMGYPNANCIGCVKATSPTYWNLVRAQHPTIFNQRAEQSREIGCRLVRYHGERIFLDELPSTAQGKPIKQMSFECGIFCEITN
jgi:hypothetical protein